MTPPFAIAMLPPSAKNPAQGHALLVSHRCWLALLKPATVVSPVEQRLALALAAREIARLAVVLKLTHVPLYRLPPLDLPCIFVRQTPPPVVPAVPLKPTSRISWM